MMGIFSWIRGLEMPVPFRDNELNKIAAFFNFSTFALTCGALIQPDWFKIRGINCVRSYTLSQFFSFENDDDDDDDPYAMDQRPGIKGMSCTPEVVVTLMRALILLCFMVLLCSSIGVMINLMSLNTKAIQMLRRNAIPSIMCVFWVIGIVGVCYYTTIEFSQWNKDKTIQVDYDYGFYTITAAGVMALLASAANLWGAPIGNDEDIHRQNLMEDWDGYETHGVGPTPAVPVLPPYTPTADYVASVHPAYAPPVLGSQQYYPFDNLSIIAPPPPYTP